MDATKPARKLNGVPCPKCNSTETRTVISRPWPEYEGKRRRRKCEDCGKLFDTLEAAIPKNRPYTDSATLQGAA